MLQQNNPAYKVVMVLLSNQLMFATSHAVLWKAGAGCWLVDPYSNWNLQLIRQSAVKSSFIYFLCSVRKRLKR